MKTLDDAIRLAVKAHEGQKDKNHQPYILHPLRVMLAVSTDYEKMVAVLHDVVEDTQITMTHLIDAGYPKEVVDAVYIMTKSSPLRYDDYIEGVKQNPIARTVKIADIRDNASPMRLYMLDPDTIDRLTKKYSKALKFLLEE